MPDFPHVDLGQLERMRNVFGMDETTGVIASQRKIVLDLKVRLWCVCHQFCWLFIREEMCLPGYTHENYISLKENA